MSMSPLIPANTRDHAPRLQKPSPWFAVLSGVVTTSFIFTYALGAVAYNAPASKHSSTLLLVQSLSAEDYFRQAFNKQQSGDNRGAIADYDQAIRLRPNYADAYYNRGLSKAAIGD
ncbi:MAG: tetratricopeptide repeat protein, partial [Cyanobacteria bacterium]|nr:tetratricopeptide repeat protein [Cyanobacteriota bacterium]